jgi:hypothetical protein
LEFPGGGANSKEEPVNQAGTSAAQVASAVSARSGRAPASTWANDIIEDGSPQTLARRVRQLSNAVDLTLLATSKEYRVLSSLRSARLPGSEQCESMLEASLSENPHYRVLLKLREAESVVTFGAYASSGPRNGGDWRR